MLDRVGYPVGRKRLVLPADTEEHASHAGTGDVREPDGDAVDLRAEVPGKASGRGYAPMTVLRVVPTGRARSPRGSRRAPARRGRSARPAGPRARPGSPRAPREHAAAGPRGCPRRAGVLLVAEHLADEVGPADRAVGDRVERDQRPRHAEGTDHAGGQGRRVRQVGRRPGARVADASPRPRARRGRSRRPPRSRFRSA